METLKKKRDNFNNSQCEIEGNPIDGKGETFKKTSSVKCKRGLSDPTRPLVEEGSGAPDDSTESTPPIVIRNGRRVRPTKPNNKCNFPAVNCSNPKSKTRLTEIHWRLSYDFVYSIIKKKSGTANYLQQYGYYVMDILSWVMGTSSNFKIQESFIQDVYFALNNISSLFAFDRTFLSQEFMNIDICTEYFPNEVKNPLTNRREILLGDFTEYFGFKVTCAKKSQAMTNVNSAIQYRNTFFAHFNLERFQDMGKDKIGSIHDFKVFLVLFFVFYADDCNFGRFDMNQFQKEIEDFTKRITATSITLKRTVPLRNISYFSLFTIMSNYQPTGFTVTSNIENKLVEIYTRDINLQMTEGQNNTVCFALTIRTHNEIYNASGTVVMDDILDSPDLDLFFDNVMSNIFTDIQGNLLLPITEVRSLETIRYFFLACGLKDKPDGLSNCISTILLKDNPNKNTNPQRYRDLYRRTFPENRKKQDNTKKNIDELKKDYSTARTKKGRGSDEKTIRKILGV